MLGGTGLVGQCVLGELLRSSVYARVIALTRRPIGVNDTKLTNVVSGMRDLQETATALAVDDLFLCMGTTRAQTPSLDEYRRVDFGIPAGAARMALERGARRVALVSSIGASRKSRAFYLRVKGELEQAIGDLPFEERHIFRPSFLMGRRGSDRRFENGMAVGFAMLSQVLIGPLKKYHAIRGSDLARAMVVAVNRDVKGTVLYEYEQIMRAARA